MNNEQLAMVMVASARYTADINCLNAELLNVAVRGKQWLPKKHGLPQKRGS